MELVISFFGGIDNINITTQHTTELVDELSYGKKNIFINFYLKIVCILNFSDIVITNLY